MRSYLCLSNNLLEYPDRKLSSKMLLSRLPLRCFKHKHTKHWKRHGLKWPKIVQRRQQKPDKHICHLTTKNYITILLSHVWNNLTMRWNQPEFPNTRRAHSSEQSNNRTPLKHRKVTKTCYKSMLAIVLPDTGSLLYLSKQTETNWQHLGTETAKYRSDLTMDSALNRSCTSLFSPGFYICDTIKMDYLFTISPLTHGLGLFLICSWMCYHVTQVKKGDSSPPPKKLKIKSVNGLTQGLPLFLCPYNKSEWVPLLFGYLITSSLVFCRRTKLMQVWTDSLR